MKVDRTAASFNFLGDFVAAGKIISIIKMTAIGNQSEMTLACYIVRSTKILNRLLQCDCNHVSFILL